MVAQEIEDMFVAIDVETTGLSPMKNELIEVSAIKYKRASKVEVFSTLIQPKEEIPFYITKITGITNQMVKNCPKIEAIMPRLVQFIGDCPIVAHNASFDVSFLQNNSRE